jgi:DNA-binding transcriptional MerR regulator
MGSKSYTTTEAAKKLGVTRATLQAWIMKGLLQPPEIKVRIGKPPVRLWTTSEIERARAMQSRIKAGRPKKKKA